jgi:hypothetical protein
VRTHAAYTHSNRRYKWSVATTAAPRSSDVKADVSALRLDAAPDTSAESSELKAALGKQKAKAEQPGAAVAADPLAARKVKFTQSFPLVTVNVVQFINSFSSLYLFMCEKINFNFFTVTN